MDAAVEVDLVVATEDAARHTEDGVATAVAAAMDLQEEVATVVDTVVEEDPSIAHTN